MVFVCAIDVKQQQNSFSPLPQPDMEIINRTTWKLCWVTGLTACHILGKKSSPASCICLVNRVFWSVTVGSMSWNSITLLLGKTRLSPCFWNGARSQRKNGNSMGVRWGNWDNYMSMYSIVCIILYIYIYIYTRTAELSSWLISRDLFFCQLASRKKIWLTCDRTRRGTWTVLTWKTLHVPVFLRDNGWCRPFKQTFVNRSLSMGSVHVLISDQKNDRCFMVFFPISSIHFWCRAASTDPRSWTSLARPLPRRQRILPRSAALRCLRCGQRREPLAADAGDAAGDAKDAGDEGCHTAPWMFLGVSWDFYVGFHRGLMENPWKTHVQSKMRTGMAHQQPKCWN